MITMDYRTQYKNIIDNYIYITGANCVALKLQIIYVKSSLYIYTFIHIYTKRENKHINK